MNRRTGRYKNVYADNLKGKQVVLEKVITKEVIITNDPAVLSGVGTTVIDTDGPVVDGGSALTTLAALTDTTISSPSTNQVLLYSGGSWINSAAPQLATPTLDYDLVNPVTNGSHSLSGTGAMGSAAGIKCRLHRLYFSDDVVWFNMHFYDIDLGTAEGVNTYTFDMPGFSTGSTSTVFKNEVNGATANFFIAGTHSAQNANSSIQSGPISMVDQGGLQTQIVFAVSAGTGTGSDVQISGWHFNASAWV